MDKKKLLDKIGQKIIRVLQDDARLSFAEVGKIVGLSPPAVIERIRRMEEAGIITGYHAQIDAEATGAPVTAFVHLRCPAEKYAQIISLSRDIDAILECHHISGDHSLILKIAVPSIPALEKVVTRLGRFGSTATSLVLSSPVVKHSTGQTCED